MLIRNANAFIENQFVKTDIRITNGRISEIGTLEAQREPVYDAQDRYVLPGFVDIHIHAFAGADCMRGEADVRKMSQELLKTGVAAFVPTTMSAWPRETHDALAGIQAVMDRPEANGAAVLGAHMEAPFLSPKYRGAQLAECMCEPSIKTYEELTCGLSCVKILTLAPELEGAKELIEALRKRSVVTCAAHSGASAAQVHAAADAGLTMITHIFNAQSPLHHREPGVPGAGLADDRITVQMIADGIHLHPDILRIVALCKGATGVALISDSMEAAGLPDGIYALGGQKVIVREGAARLENGALAGSTLKLHDAVRNMIQKTGIAPEEVIPMATSTPARMVGAKNYGKIQIGSTGILAAMDKEWNFIETLMDKEIGA